MTEGDRPNIWPQRRPDGSVSLTIRCATDVILSPERLDLIVDDWLADRSSEQIAAMERDLAAAPKVVRLSATEAEVTINTKPGRGYWARDWLVMLTRAIFNAVPGAPVLGFSDEVGGVFRPYDARNP